MTKRTFVMEWSTEQLDTSHWFTFYTAKILQQLQFRYGCGSLVESTYRIRMIDKS